MPRGGAAGCAILGDMDPYVLQIDEGLDMGSQTSTARSMSAQDGGVAPRWGESLDRLLALMPGGDERHLSLEIWNENNTTDEFIGQCCVPLIGGPQWASGERGFGVPITAELNTVSPKPTSVGHRVFIYTTSYHLKVCLPYTRLTLRPGNLLTVWKIQGGTVTFVASHTRRTWPTVALYTSNCW